MVSYVGNAAMSAKNKSKETGGKVKTGSHQMSDNGGLVDHLSDYGNFVKGRKMQLKKTLNASCDAVSCAAQMYTAGLTRGRAK